MRNVFAHFTWPSSCWVCAAWPTQPICPSCHAQHARLRPRCPGCALALAPGLSRCTDCTTQGAPSAPDTAHARVDFVAPWNHLVHRFKFAHDPSLAHVLAQLMLQDESALQQASHCDWATPVPVAPERLVERGYNQSWELLRQLRRRHPLPSAHPGLLQRQAHAPALHTLNRKERQQAAQGLLEVPPPLRAQLRGARVLLIDDVMTTGATARAAATALRAAGASAVHLWVFARTPRPGTLLPGME